MSPGAINLVPAVRRAIEVSLARLMAALLLAVVLWLIGWRGWVAHQEAARLRAEQARIESADAQLQRSRSTKTLSVSAPSAQQVAAVDAAVRSLNTPWRDLFEMIEVATPSTIDLIALDPDAASGQLALTAEAGSADDMFAYVRRLKREELTSSAVLVAHELAEGVGGVSRLRFRLMLHWGGNGGSP